MSIKRRQHSAAFKAEVALNALKENCTITELSKKHLITPSKIYEWKKIAREGLSSLFSSNRKIVTGMSPAEADKLYAQIGRLKMENDFLKKSLES